MLPETPQKHLKFMSHVHVRAQYWSSSASGSRLRNEDQPESVPGVLGKGQKVTERCSSELIIS